MHVLNSTCRWPSSAPSLRLLERGICLQRKKCCCGNDRLKCFMAYCFHAQADMIASSFGRLSRQQLGEAPNETPSAESYTCRESNATGTQQQGNRQTGLFCPILDSPVPICQFVLERLVSMMHVNDCQADAVMIPVPVLPSVFFLCGSISLLGAIHVIYIYIWARYLWPDFVGLLLPAGLLR